jgi:superfamily II DNA or RNA helicase
MISITCDKEAGNLDLKVYGDDFTDTVEFLKGYGCKFNPTKKVWTRPISLLKLFKADLAVRHIDFDISDYDERQAEEYLKSLVELKTSEYRRKVDFTHMNYPPLEGKHPNELYQKQDISRAINQNRFLFNWEMGLGKSYALAALIDNLRNFGLINKCLIFSTGVGVFNLKDELCKFCKNLQPDDILVLNSLTESKYEDRDLFNEEKYPQSILIMTYDSFKGVNNYYYDKLNGTKKNPKPSLKTKYRKSFIPITQWLDGKPGAIFLDECHSLSIPSSRRSEIFKMNLDPFDYRYLFTGTLADKYEKLYMPLMILDKSLVNGLGYTEWLGQYNDLGNRFSAYAINDDKWDLVKLGNLNRELLQKYASKRLMDECLDLPPDYDIPTIRLDMMPLQRKIYEGFVQEQLRIIKERSAEQNTSEKDNILNMFQVFQLAVDNPECIKASASWDKLPEHLQADIKKYNNLKDSAKMIATSEIIKERTDENGERGIIWYFHPATKDSLVKLFEKYKPIVIEAGLTPEERSKRIKEFKENPEHKLIIGSINIMNTSITLIECKYQVYTECTYNYTVYSQSRGRIHRPNQDSITRTYSLCYNNSIDGLQKQNLEQKGAVINSLLNKNYIDQGMWKKIFNANLNDTY